MSYINEFSHATTRALRAPQWATSSGTSGIEEMPAVAYSRRVIIPAGGSSLLRMVKQDLNSCEKRNNAVSQWLCDQFQNPKQSQPFPKEELEGRHRSENADVLALMSREEALCRRQQCQALRGALPSGDLSLASQDALQSLAESLERAGTASPQLLAETDERRAIMISGEQDEGYASGGDEWTGPTINAFSGAINELVNASQSDSSQDFFEDIFALLDRLDKEWLSRFGDILSNYVGFFNKLTDAMALLSKAIVDHDDKGNLNVNFDDLRNALEGLISEVENGPGLGGDFRTRAEAEEFLKDLGLEGLVVKPTFGGGFELAVDPKMIRDLSTLFEEEGEQPMNPAAHAAIISAKDSLMERFNHINRVLPDKYQRQLQVWDTLVKALSGTIDSMAEANRLIAQNIG